VRQVLSQQTVRLNLKQLFAGSSSNVYKSVLVGKSAAGAVLDVDFDAQPEDVKAQLTPLVRTPKMAPHPISAHPRVPKQLQQALEAAVIKMGSTAEGKKLLRAVQLSDPVPADYARDYKVLEKMDYDALTKGI
jgi:ABC-type phosphate/phosphonate transport system, periplasmic component